MRILAILSVVLALAATSAAVAEPGKPAEAKPTWVEIGGKIYGARADERGPIGGGPGYMAVVTTGEHRVKSLDELLAALAKAKKGEVVFIPGTVEIDVTARRFTDDLVIEIPGGVTLAGDRGRDGSPGAVIYSDAFDTAPMIRVTGPGVRISGLRIRGPDPKRRLEHHRRAFAERRGSSYYYRFPNSNGIATTQPELEVDNCELSGWSHAAIFLIRGSGHHVHHNHIHHNQRQGLGYGVCHDSAESLIEHNRFNFNRHSIAGTGRPGCAYEAANNVELGESLGHCFDMHGGRDRKDGTNIAGDWLKVHHNTFRAAATEIRIRGLPQKQAEVFGNWFYHGSAKSAVNSPGRTRVHDNAFGVTGPKVIGGSAEE